MAYIKPYIDEIGIHTSSYDDILQDLITKYKGIYGDDIYLEPDSQDYQQVSAFALITYDLNQALVMNYNNMNPQTAIGQNLDRLVSINGIARLENTYSTAILRLTGKANTILSYPAVVDINGFIWQLQKTVTFDSLGTDIYELASCTTAGDIPAAPYTINIIKEPVSDWYSATNVDAAIPGSPVETDSKLRIRRKRAVSIPSLTVLAGIISDIEMLAGITKVIGYENDTGNTVDTIYPHSIAIVAEGGVDEEIASLIYYRKAPGVGTFGDVPVIVTNDKGIETIINFSRAAPVTITTEITVQSLDSWYSSNVDTIKENIVNYINGMNIGEDLYVNNLSIPILATITDYTKPSFYIKGIACNTQDELVDIGKFEIAKVLLSDITVTIL